MNTCIMSLPWYWEPLVNCATVQLIYPRRNGRHFADDIFTWIFVNEKFHNMIKISLKLGPKCSIDNNLALVEIMASRLFGAKPLYEPMLNGFTDAYIRHYGEISSFIHRPNPSESETRIRVNVGLFNLRSAQLPRMGCRVLNVKEIVA